MLFRFVQLWQLSSPLGCFYSTFVLSGNILKLSLEWQMAEEVADLWKSKIIHYTKKAYAWSRRRSFREKLTARSSLAAVIKPLNFSDNVQFLRKLSEGHLLTAIVRRYQKCENGSLMKLCGKGLSATFTLCVLSPCHFKQRNTQHQ